MGTETLYRRVVNLECDVATLKGLVAGIITKAIKWNEHVEKKERLLNKMENIRRRKRAKIKRVERDKEAAAIQDECDRENMQIEMKEDKQKDSKQLLSYMSKKRVVL